MAVKISYLVAAIVALVLAIRYYNPPETQKKLNDVPKKPNIVFILADDLGWNDVSFHGSGQIPTPNLDALAFSGVVLQNYYAQPICTPSRSALMTGKHPIRMGLQHNVNGPADKYGLPLEEVILPQHLQSLGYGTHLVGKWHMGHHTKAYWPNSRGFDSFYGYLAGMNGYYDHMVFYPYVGWNGYDMRDNSEVDWSAYGTYTTTLLSEKAEAVIKAHDPEKPFFLYMSHLAAHVGNVYAPLQAPAETIARFSHIEDPDRRNFAGMVHEMDQSVGRLVQALSDRNMLKDTIIVFSSDNGGAPAPMNMNAGSNWPLRGGKNTTWEGGVRVNGFVWSPLIPEKRRGEIFDGLVDISDWLPTLYEAAGGKVSDLGEMDGISQWKSLVDGKPSKRDQLLHNIDDIFGYASVRKGNYKLVKGTTYEGKYDVILGPQGHDNPSKEWSSTDSKYKSQLMGSKTGQSLAALDMKLPLSISTLRDKLKIECKKPRNAVPCNPQSGQPCLFDIDADPCEYNNLADEMPRKVKDLLAIIEEYRAVAVPPINLDKSLLNDPKSSPKFWNCTITNWMELPFDPSQEAKCPERII